MATTTPDRKTWLIIFAATTGAVLLYGVICFFMAQYRAANPIIMSKLPSDVLRLISSMMAIIALIASVAWMYIKTSGKIGDGSTYEVAKAELMTPSGFQNNSLTALGLSVACSSFGLTFFFISATFRDFVPFALGTLLVNLFYILPRGLKYWSSWEQERKEKGQPANSPFSQSL